MEVRSCARIDAIISGSSANPGNSYTMQILSKFFAKNHDW
jgi:hypothetical protein